MKKLLFIFAFILAASHFISGQTDKAPDTPILNGLAETLPKPDFPQMAKDFCAKGLVSIKAVIDENGQVSFARVISGDRLLRDAALAALKKAKFRKTTFGGKPIKVEGVIVYNFPSEEKCINAGIVNKKALKLPKPALNISPPKKEAITAVQIMVDMDGKVTAAKAIAGHPLIRTACENAARQAKFSPAFINGPPVKVRALLVYKFKPDGSIDTDVEKDDKDVIGTPVNLVEPPSVSCNCRFGSANPKVVVVAEIDEGGNVSKAEAVSGHPALRPASKAAALTSKFLPLNIKSKLFITYSFEETSKWSVKFSGIDIKNASVLK